MPSLISRRAMLGGLLVGAAAMVAAPLIVEPERCPHCGHRALMPDGRCLHCKRMVSRRAYSFGREGREIGLIREQLGDFPLVGFSAGGEISNARLYGYTGILVLFL